MNRSIVKQVHVHRLKDWQTVYAYSENEGRYCTTAIPAGTLTTTFSHVRIPSGRGLLVVGGSHPHRCRSVSQSGSLACFGLVLFLGGLLFLLSIEAGQILTIGSMMPG